MLLVQQFIVVFTNLLIVVFSSCSSTATKERLIAHLDSTLAQSNKITKRNNENLRLAFEEKAKNPATKEKGFLWLPKAQKIDSLSSVLLAYLESVKMSILDGKEDRKQTENIYPLLMAFKEAILPIHERMKDVSALNFQSDQTSTSLSALFSDASPFEAKALLTSVENQVLIATNGSLLVCLDQTVSHEHYTAFEALVGQNAKVLHVGDSLEITTGIGAFDRLKKSEILIDGKRVVKDYSGLAIYKIKTSNKPGSYSVPVSLTFNDEDGKQQTRTFQVKYQLVSR